IADLINSNKILYDHSSLVTLTAVSIAKKMGFSDTFLRIVALGSLFHDIGITRLDIPDIYVRRISPEYQKTYERHPSEGVEILNDLDASLTESFPEEVFMIIMQHHERFNGTGFPNGKKGRLTKQNPEGSHILSLIVALADSFASYFTGLTGRPKYTSQKAVLSLLRLDGNFDPEVVAAFKTIMNFSGSLIEYNEDSVKIRSI
ncbi:MAG: HD domain-containing protein, partial [Oligoflexales bacterium]|nr:HD domain-containing protein [Oligoflexales bacterium]